MRGSGDGLEDEASDSGELASVEPGWSNASKIMVSLALAFLVGVLALLCAEYHVARLENTLVAPAETP
jgi:hypothetical protein